MAKILGERSRLGIGAPLPTRLANIGCATDSLSREPNVYELFYVIVFFFSFWSFKVFVLITKEGDFLLSEPVGYCWWLFSK